MNQKKRSMRMSTAWCKEEKERKAEDKRQKENIQKHDSKSRSCKLFRQSMKSQ
jgi:hypothetical protein